MAGDRVGYNVITVRYLAFIFLFHSRLPFKSYLDLPSAGDLKRIKNLVVDTKMRDIKVVSILVKRMLERNVFLFGSVDANEGSATERINELTEIQNARVQTAYKM